jgi:prepilin-type processing-associated H-X9-DG protein
MPNVARMKGGLDMYKIIGADNAEYGPVSTEQIRQWIGQGRLNGQTRVQPEGSAEWKTLAELSEFKGLIPPAGSVPPVSPANAEVPGKTSGLAIASLVLGLLGWFTLGLTALVGLGLGIAALVRIKDSRGALRGHGLALAGTVISGLMVLMLPIMAAMLLPALARAKSRAQSINCMNNLKQLALGEMMYATENKDHFPQAENWCDALGKYVGNTRVYLCPAGDPTLRCHYAFNASLSGVDTKNVTAPAETVLIFETEGGWNQSGGRDQVLGRPRHGPSIGIVFADGHAEIVRENRLAKVKWEP